MLDGEHEKLLYVNDGECQEVFPESACAPSFTILKWIFRQLPQKQSLSPYRKKFFSPLACHRHPREKSPTPLESRSGPVLVASKKVRNELLWLLTFAPPVFSAASMPLAKKRAPGANQEPARNGQEAPNTYRRPNLFTTSTQTSRLAGKIAR